MINIHRQLLEHIQSGEPVALATVVKTSGSTPQKPGSSALFGEKGLIAGTIGGGQLEGDVDKIAKHALISGLSSQYYFNLDTQPEMDGAICGGEAEILLDANPDQHKKTLEDMAQALGKGLSGHICTIVSKIPEEGLGIERFWVPQDGKAKLPEAIPSHIRDSIKTQLTIQAGEGFREIELPSQAKGGKQCLFMESIKPLPRLIIAGAGHVGRALAHLASLLDFEITIVDDRREFACMGNVPDADHFLVKDMGLAMSEIELTPATYIVIVTRGHESDAECLKPCLGSEAAYVGMIGSRTKVATMKKQFIESGLASEEEWARIHSPIGIPVASKTVQEIAISIAAQLVQERAKKQTGHA